MVTSTRSGGDLLIIARPDHSSCWRNNMLLLLALAVPSLGAAISFTLMGAWPILPLAGLELLALGFSLYVVNRKLQYRQVITVNGDTVTVDKGYRCPKESWRFSRQAAGLSIVPEDHPWDSPTLSLHDRSESVSLGEFLGREDKLTLIDLLRGELRVRSDTRLTRQAF